MNSRRPFLFILSFTLKHSASFGIAEIPPQAKRNDVVTLLSTYPEVDPTSFTFAAAPTSYPDSKDGVNIGTAEVEKQTGTMKSTFSKDDGYDTVFQLGILLTSKIMGIFTVNAYDTEALSASELQRRGEGCVTGPTVAHTLLTCHIGGGGLFGGPTGSAEAVEGLDNPHNSPSTLTTPPASATPTATSTPTVPMSPTMSTTTTAPTTPAPGGQDSTPNDPPASNSAPASIRVPPSTPSTHSPSSIVGESAQQVSGKPTGAGLGSVPTGGNRSSTSLVNSSQQRPPATSTEPSTTPPSGTPPQTRHSDIGKIIGAILGALLLLILVLLVILCYHRRRKHHQDKTSKPAVKPTTVIGLCCWRKRDRNAEGPSERDGNVRAVSPYTLSGPGFGFVTGKHSLDVPASYVTPQEAQDYGTDTSENQGVDQPNMNVYVRLDMISRDLADLRRLMHDRGVEESLPEYSSQ
ncbi:hypothetical protein PQX77_019933 [Marasmius sp. AFHP31]|nr:hypothetical protein PQX77_019933 [Marasmius sp. AFHP31]